MIAHALLVASLSAASEDAERPLDLVRLAGGKSLSGHVVYEDESRLILLEGTRERVVPLAEIAEVRSVARALRAFLSELDRISTDDAAALLALAESVRAQLPGESDVLLWRVLSFDPGNATAHERLGHAERDGRWTVRADGRSYVLAELERYRADFGHAWELRTTHYAVRTNTDLATAVALAIDLERTYAALVAFLGRELELRDPVRRMDARIHADAASFPEALGGRRSYFDAKEEALIVDATKGVDRVTLVHEAAHELLWACGPGRGDARAELPAWVDEGLAVYLAAGVRGGPGRLGLSPGPAVPSLFREHAQAAKPLDLGRVLTLGADDFAATSGQSLKYAQAYTLVHYLLHGDGGAHRAAFFDFLRGCWKGSSSSTDFKKAIGVRERELEEAWTAYAAQNG